MVSFTYEQNIICSQTQLDDIAHEQTNICRSRVGLSSNKKEEKFASNDESCEVVLTFESVDENVCCDHSNKTSLSAIPSQGATCLSTFYERKFGNFDELNDFGHFCEWILFLF